MAEFLDIKIDAEGDLVVDKSTSDILIDFSDRDHISDIAVSYPGEWKQFPFVGIGIGAFEKISNPVPRLISAARLQYDADGYVNDPKAKLDNSGNLVFNPQAFRK